MQVVSATFPDRDSAVATREALGDEHYSFRWLATTKPSEHPHVDHDKTELNELAESSDGAVGAVGRFLSGAGSSLSKALIDHGVEREDAATIDTTIGTGGAVLVVHASDDRAAEAAKVLEAGGGHVIGMTIAGTVPVFGTAKSPGFHAVDDPADPLADPATISTPVAPAIVTPAAMPISHEEIFMERRTVPPPDVPLI